jgi:putative membrane protein
LIKSKFAALYLKGFAMGMADIIPGVSGGTIAFITGIYEELIDSISSFDHHFFKNILSFKFRKAFDSINIRFLITLFFGIISAILITSRIVHFLLDNYSIYTWAFFFGLILSSIIFLINKINNFLSIKTISSIFF